MRFANVRKRSTVAEMIQVSVAYVGPVEQVLCPLEMEAGTTVGAAIDRSGVLESCPEIDLGVFKVGIYGKVVKLEQVLGDGDRVEIYRPLIADPKQARKRRAGQTQMAAGASGNG